MTDRAALRSEFLSQTPYSSWAIDPLAADASARSYFRLRSEDKTIILADVPPDVEDYSQFLEISELLNTAGLNVPRCVAADRQNGFFIITDLGPTVLAEQLSKHPGDREQVYPALIDLLCVLKRIDPPQLNRLDPAEAGNMLTPLFDHYGGREKDVVQAAMTTCFAKHVSKTTSLSLRDFHAENLIWCPTENGVRKFGLLDFQDAFLAPDGYDLASFTRDVRRDISTLDQTLLEHMYADACGLDRKDFGRQIAILSVQRNLRILGVFSKLIENGKPRYRHFLPQVWKYIVQDLAHPDLTDFAKVILAHIPPPEGT